MKIIEKEFNVQTGEETITERDETADEIAYREKEQAQLEAQIAEVEARAIKRAELLSKLGITEEEAGILLG